MVDNGTLGFGVHGRNWYWWTVKVFWIDMKEIEGWLSPEVAEAMRNLILKTKPAVIVEIGVFAGKSLINAALALKENGFGVIYGIDPWRGGNFLDSIKDGDDLEQWRSLDLEKIHQDCMKAIWDNKLEKHVVIIRATSRQCAQIATGSPWPTVDILYIDGAHSETESCFDAETYTPCVKSGGYIWFDDSNWPSTQKALSILEQHCRLVTDFGHCRLYQKP